MWGHFFALSVVVATALGGEVSIPSNAIKNGMKERFRTGTFSPQFQLLLQSMGMAHKFRSNVEEREDHVMCQLCDEILDPILEEVRGGTITSGELADVVIQLCMLLVYESYEVCEGAITANVDAVWYIALARPEKGSETICPIIGQGYGCTGTGLVDWSINIPPGSSDINHGVVSGEELQALLLTDFHYDPYYEPGSWANCNLPVCCTVNTVPVNPEDAAGFWGDYRDCDTGLHAIDEALEHISNQHIDLDVVYYGGDIIHHRVWNTSVDTNIHDLTLIFDRLDAAFPDIPIYSILGNHEPHPVNVFAPIEIQEEGLSTQWLFDLSADLWAKWLDEDALATVRQGGYYTMLVKPGFRVIGLNSNAAYIQNWWLLYDDVDPYGQLQWLADTLYQAELNGERVHILSHMPSSGGSIYAIWGREYRRILDRFAGIISGTFNGHSHRDELILYHSLENPTQPIGVTWNGGSLTTASHKNPNYKLFKLDAENFEVVDFEVWAYNLTAANLTPDINPNWFMMYSFKDAYGLSGAAPQDVRQLAINMANDRSVVEQYFRFSSRYADTALGWGCDDGCLRDMLCNLLKSEFRDFTQCWELTPVW
ncbi:sphingomyelin phosphodiesterase [Holotrichia oblita]|uniref:Sphingomyelin phosphodiesterase n=1 Tax=Holotrichia oblita TaxID=644536 RepID=A0ACB9T6U0_HOLOL|nr:sphingomyelin phosphodiesterase [Holotrichia oblita]